MFGVNKCEMFNLGDTPHDEDFDTGIVATQTGDHKVICTIAGQELRTLTLACISGQPILIPKTSESHLNEDCVIYFYIKDHSGDRIQQVIQNETYEFFHFRFFINNKI